jgi:hypothetical protein
MTAPSIVLNSASPANGDQGIPLANTISVIFDREIDETTLNAGTFVVSGPETDLATGPFLALAQDPLRPNDEDFLTSPRYTGIVQGTYTFQRLDQFNSPSDAFDYSGGGETFRTKVTFTPSRPLSASVLYTVLIAGDENSNDVINTGVMTRTVYDTMQGSVLGTGRAEITGGYLGSLNDKFNIRIVETGKIGDAKFVWWKDSQPALQFELTTSSRKQILTDGVFVQFFTDGTSDVDDFIVPGVLDADWSAVVEAGEPLADNYQWSFTTGSGSIMAPPAETSTTVGGIGDLIGSQVLSGFQILEVTPDVRATNLDPTSTTAILIRFNKDLKPGQDFDSLVRIIADAVNGDPDLPAAGNIAKTITVSGDTLTITFN